MKHINVKIAEQVRYSLPGQTRHMNSTHTFAH